MTSPQITAHPARRGNHATVFAPAKVNLTLQIHGRRTDGYHELESLVVFAHTPADRLTISKSDTAIVRANGPFSNSLGDDNLVTKTMRETRRLDPHAQLAEISLQKNIPVSAGLGGGSADAAATLHALKNFNPQSAERIDWHAIATSLGADVPVCLLSRASIMAGLGERVTPLQDFPTLHAVLVNSKTIPPTDKTARVFKQLNAPNLDPRSINPKNATKLSEEITRTRGSLEQLTQILAARNNDLEQPATAVMPQIPQVITAIKNSPQCQLARLSGAGPTCFGLYPTPQAATAAQNQIRTNHPTWWVVATQLK